MASQIIKDSVTVNKLQIESPDEIFNHLYEVLLTGTKSVDIIAQLKPKLTTVQLEALYALLKEYTNAKSTIESADEFLRLRLTNLSQVGKCMERYKDAREKEQKFNSNAETFWSMLKNIDHQIATLYSRRNQLVSLLNESIDQCKKANETMKQMSFNTVLVLKADQEFSKIASMWEMNKAMALEQVAKIEGEWEKIRSVNKLSSS